MIIASDNFNYCNLPIPQLVGAHEPTTHPPPVPGISCLYMENTDPSNLHSLKFTKVATYYLQDIYHISTDYCSFFLLSS